MTGIHVPQTRTPGSDPERDKPLDWGGARDMNAFEALMWRAEADPRLRSTIVGVEILDQLPDWDRFLAANDWATRLIPRFRMRVTEPAMGLARPTWIVDQRFDIHYHVRQIRLPVPGSMRDLMNAAQQIAMTPFDRHRPPWEAVLVDGLPEGKAALILKLHHAATDGVGITQLLGMLHSRMREPNVEKPQPLPPTPEASGQLQQLARQAGDDAKSIGSLAGGIARSALKFRRPDRAAADVLRYSTSLRRVLAGDLGKPSPLLKGRSTSWRFLALEVQFADLRAAGKAVEGSLNDIYMAGLLGAFRLYHEQLGCPIETMPVAMPINIRREGETSGGNRFVAARFAGPVGIADPERRIRAISAIVRAARNERAIEGLNLVTPLLSRLPGPVISQLAGSMTMGNDLQASNVPGFREEVFLAGAKIERIYPYAPLPGAAAMITLVSHGAICCIGANIDPAAITEPDRFGQCLVDGFKEVLSLHPGAADPVYIA